MTNIGWKDFALISAAALFLYYTWVLFIFYAKDILRLFSGETISKRVSTEKESGEPFDTIYKIQEKVNGVVASAAAKQSTREEIILALRKALEPYTSLAAPLRFSISNFIEVQCKNNCSIFLTEDEIHQLWAE